MPLNNFDLLHQQAVIVDEWVDQPQRRAFELYNCVNQQYLTHVPARSATEALPAFGHALIIFRGRRTWLTKERAAILNKWFQLIIANQEDLTRFISLEQGKPLPKSRGEVAFGAAYGEWFAEETKRSYGGIIPETVCGRKLLVPKMRTRPLAAI